MICVLATATTSGSGTSPRGRWSCATPSSSRRRAPRRRGDRRSATRAGTSPASARRRPAPCARSSSAATDSGPGARRALAAATRRPAAAAGGRRAAGLDDEAFLEHLAAAKARGKMRESAKTGIRPATGPQGEEQHPHVSARTNPPQQAPPGSYQRRPERPPSRVLDRASARCCSTGSSSASISVILFAISQVARQLRRPRDRRHLLHAARGRPERADARQEGPRDPASSTSRKAARSATAAAFIRWLVQNFLSWIFLPRLPLDALGQGEAVLAGQGRRQRGRAGRALTATLTRSGGRSVH